MPNSTIPRIIRGPDYPKNIPRSKPRRVLEYLLRDFKGRCAYSCQHYLHAGGIRSMDVDHFDFRCKKDVNQDYNNLFLATRHCNGAKWARPTAKERAAGLRFLNPCKEMDYGVHIFEDPVTHQLVGTTAVGKYHIRCCDLNAEHLVRERSDRAEIHALLETKRVTFQHPGSFDRASEEIRLLMQQVEKMIPEFPYLPSQPSPTA
jgi:hypothetical protein